MPAVEGKRRKRAKKQEGAAVTVPSKPPEIKRVHFGLDVCLTPWYSAPYPEEYYNERGELWICEFCLKYMRRLATALRHLRKCRGRLPPGDEIYRRGDISVFEINGRTGRLYCQNLCLLAKMFLDHKTLYYDVDPFLFYILIEWRRPSKANSSHSVYSFVGYFSKEKSSPANYNVSCILTMPHQQRKGYGSFLIDFSYMLTRHEQRLGTPEKPLSDLGLFAYVNYWCYAVMRAVISAMQASTPSLNFRGSSTSTTAMYIAVDGICRQTGMTPNDVLATLEHLSLLYAQSEDKLCISADALQVEVWKTRLAKLDNAADPQYLLWSPYTCIR